MKDFIDGFFGLLVGYFILWLLVAMIYWVVCQMFFIEFNPMVVWGIIGLIFTIHMFVKAGKNLDDM